MPAALSAATVSLVNTFISISRSGLKAFAGKRDAASALCACQRVVERGARAHRGIGLLDVGHVVAADVHRLALHVRQLADDRLLARRERGGERLEVRLQL